MHHIKWFLVAEEFAFRVVGEAHCMHVWPTSASPTHMSRLQYKKYKYFQFSLVDSQNSRTFAEILKGIDSKIMPFLTKLEICKLSNALADM